jgi:endogenous inhibitor of DNA gyrase (YacG/DUF329 family)
MIIKCLNCGKKFDGLNINYCSDRCKINYNTKYHVCTNCLRRFDVNNSYYKQFCSIKCKKEHNLKK